MTEIIAATLPLQRWQSEKATYHLVIFKGAQAETIAGHALMQWLELGRSRGFGSLKVTARIGGTEWQTSLFPQEQQSQWFLLINKKVMKAEDLAPNDQCEVSVTPL